MLRSAWSGFRAPRPGGRSAESREPPALCRRAPVIRQAPGSASLRLPCRRVVSGERFSSRAVGTCRSHRSCERFVGWCSAVTAQHLRSGGFDARLRWFRGHGVTVRLKASACKPGVQFCTLLRILSAACASCACPSTASRTSRRRMRDPPHRCQRLRCCRRPAGASGWSRLPPGSFGRI